MGNLIIGIIGLLIGFVLIRQSQKARKVQNRKVSILWMIGSAIFALFGLCQLAIFFGA